MSGKTLVFVRTSGVHRLPVYRQLVALGIRIVFVHPVRVAAFEEVASDWILMDTFDAKALVPFVLAELEERKIKPGAVLSLDEFGVYPSAVISEALGQRPVPLPPRELQQTMVKSQFRQWCKDNGVNSPGFVSVASAADCDAKRDAIAAMKFPVVAKPSPGAGSCFAKKCESVDEVEAFLKDVAFPHFAAHPDAVHWGALGVPVHMLVEEYMYGAEVDVDCVVADGKVLFAGISDNNEVQAPYFSETGGFAPSALPPAAQMEIMSLLEQFVTAHGNKLRGVLHFEAKYDHKEQIARVVEVNCRLGGAETYTMVKTAWGLDMGVALAMVALGHVPNLKAFQNPVAVAASINYYPPTTGVLQSDPFSNTVTTDAAYVAHQLYTQVGSAFRGPPVSYACMSWMVAAGASHEEAKGNLARLVNEMAGNVELLPPSMATANS